MAPTPENCVDRVVIDGVVGEQAFCRALSRMTGVTEQSACTVQRDACVACCKSIRAPQEINPTVASLMYTMASRIISQGGHSECSVDRAHLLVRRAINQLSIVVRELPNESFPPSLSSPTYDTTTTNAGFPSSFRWAMAMLTAPRAEPKIEQTLDSLRNAGFEDVHIFAEPEAWIPERFSHLPVTKRPQRFGNFLNFYSCLSTLTCQHPDADAYAIFQDDIQLATGLRQWCEEQLWPLNNGIVSLFTPRLHANSKAGWQIVSPGFQRVCGAQALIFRKDLLQKFLADARVIHSLRLRHHYDDAVLGGWLSREGLGIAYHTPSPVQHVGRISSLFGNGHDLRNLANAVESVSEISNWTNSNPKTANIGLVGWNTSTGLGSINRDLVSQLGIKRWLSPPHPQLPVVSSLPPIDAQIETDVSNPETLLKWVRELDWLLFAERPYIEELPRIAAHNGVGIACIPMWEWVRPNLPWLQFVDLMICPTLLAYRQMEDWTRRYGYGWKTVYIPWPIDVQRFQFQQREVCREFLFVNGWGGGATYRLDGSPAPYHRKGLELIVAAAKLAPDLKFIIRSLQPISFNLPSNICVEPSLEDNADLYDTGDVCVQPSHYEGLGLQLLECQSAGMPLVTTSGPPMNEANPWRTIPTSGRDVVNLWGTYIAAELMTPKALVATLRPLVGMDIRSASRQARAYVESEHNWDAGRRQMLAELVRR